MSASELSLLMQQLIPAIEQLGAKEIKLLLANKATLNLTVTPIDLTQKTPIQMLSIGSSEVDEVAAQLEVATSRSQGTEILKTLNKTHLQALAKKFSISADSGITKDRLVEKIVERRVGLRLRQDAFATAMHAH